MSNNLSHTQVIERIRARHPELSFNFVASNSYMWSPEKQQVTYRADDSSIEGTWALLHESAHAVCGHKNYISDFELLLMEREAWDMAIQISRDLAITIDVDHIEDCLDSYRDWQHKRSLCPRCKLGGVQKNTHTYSCLFCNMEWSVSRSRFCRTYRIQS